MVFLWVGLIVLLFLGSVRFGWFVRELFLVFLFVRLGDLCLGWFV